MSSVCTYNRQQTNLAYNSMLDDQLLSAGIATSDSIMSYVADVPAKVRASEAERDVSYVLVRVAFGQHFHYG